MRRRPTLFDRNLHLAIQEVIDGLPSDPTEADWELIQEAVREAVLESAGQVATELERTMGRAIDHEESIRIGFEHRLYRIWGPGLDRLHAVIIAAREVGYEIATDSERSRTTTSQVLVRIHARCCLVAAEGLTLLRAGYASGANARWRSLHELAVVAFFVAKHGDDVAERFLLHLNVGRLRRAKAERTHAASLGISGLPDRELDAMQARVDHLATRFGPSFMRDYGWAASALGLPDPTFRAIEEVVDLDHIRPFYRIASEPIHAGPAGLFDDLGADASRGTIMLAGASNTGLRIPGQGLAIALNQATAALLKDDPDVERLVWMAAINELTSRCIAAFARADYDSERLVSIAHGHRARRAVFARRAGKVRARYRVTRRRSVA